MQSHPTPRPRPVCAARKRLALRQRGVVLLFGMIALVVLMVGTAALVRSMNTSLMTAGNFGFKRDLTNQGERAIQVVLDLMDSGALATEAARQSNNINLNYSASLLPTNAQGIPQALLSDAQFAGVGIAANDIAIADMGITVRYVVDRMSDAAGPADTSNTLMADNAVPGGGSASQLMTAELSSSGGSGAIAMQVVYRISVRVTGPRNTQSFYQSTFKL
jgi:type IV pilus assembly protein PilX